MRTETASGLRPLEPRLYLDPEVLEREQRAIFARSWQYAAHSASCATPAAT